MCDYYIAVDSLKLGFRFLSCKLNLARWDARPSLLDKNPVLSVELSIALQKEGDGRA